MGSEAHVVHIGGRNHVFGHGYRIIPKTEIVYPIGAFGHSEKRLAVGTFHAHHQQIFTLPLYGTRIHHRIHPNAFHQVRISLFIQVITPEYRRMGGGNYRIAITRIYAISLFLGDIFPGNQFLMFVEKFLYFFYKRFHVYDIIYK